MFDEALQALGALPEWLVVGILLGTGLSVLVAGIFVVGERLSPTRTAGETTWSGDDRRRQELRQYLAAIDEQFAEDHFVEGHTVAFYLPKRDVAITFDARAYYRIDRSRTHAVLVEHEMPGVHLGTRLPFETPELDFGTGAAAAVDPIEEAYAVLDLPRSASESEVKAAYREKVKEVHPDHGGDHEAFTRVREAYTTAQQAT